MRRDLDPKILWGGALIVTLLLGSGALAYFNTRRIQDDKQWVVHTQQVLDALEVLLSTAKDAETGQRGFLLTRNDAYLEPYRQAITRIDPLVARIAALTADNPVQQARIPRLRELLAARLDVLATIIAVDRERGPEAARELLQAGHGRMLMDQLRALVGEMKQTEEGLMRERLERSQRSYRFAITSGLATTALGLLLMSALAVLLERYLRRRAEAAAALHDQKEVLRTTLASIGDGVITTDLAGRVTFLNGVAASLTGWADDAGIGRPLEEIFRIANETTGQSVENPALRSLRDGRIVGLANHTVLFARDGTQHPIDDSAAPIRNQDGAVFGSVLVFRDVTEQRRKDRTIGELLASERSRSTRLAEVATASSTINTATTTSSVVGVVTTEAKRILAAEEAEFVADSDAAAERRDGTLVAALVGRGGRAIGQLRVARAATPFGDDDATLRQLAQMAAVALDNARLYEELCVSDRRKDEFIATLAHELRNPLAPIRNALRLLRSADHDEALAEESRAMIERQVVHVVRLVDDLLDVSRISQGRLNLRLERLDLGSALEAALETSRPLIEEARHRLTRSWPSTPIAVDGDATRLAQVFGNLLNNAARYTEPGGRIWITAEPRVGRVLVSVRDDGIGIAADMLPRVFDMFTQVHPTSELHHGGLGIGLTLVKHLVELHGGTIEARSEGLGEGSEFIVSLPLAATAAAALPVTPTGGEPAAPVLDGGHRRVLVVDDNRDALESLALLLRVIHFEVSTAGDGLEAVERFTSFRPDVVLLDIGLPRLNGYEVAQRIRGLPGGRDVTLIALTGWGQSEDQRRAREAGFDLHLVKPVDPEALEKLLVRSTLAPRGVS